MKILRVKEKYTYREVSGHRGCSFAHVHVLTSKRRRVLLVFEERNGNVAGRREARMTGTWVRPKEPRVWCQLAREILDRTLHRKTFFDLPIRIWRLSSWRSSTSLEIFKSRLAKQVYKSDIFYAATLRNMYADLYI